MPRTLIALLVLAATVPSARADETDTPVEIVRGTDGRAVSPKVIEIAPDNGQAGGPEGSDGSEGAAKSADAEQAAQKQAEEARARAERQRQIEELARKNQEQWRKAANALAGE